MGLLASKCPASRLLARPLGEDLDDPGAAAGDVEVGLRLLDDDDLVHGVVPLLMVDVDDPENVV
jgi:hypothetical protein